jgi:hypothetical protein
MNLNYPTEKFASKGTGTVIHNRQQQSHPWKCKKIGIKITSGGGSKPIVDRKASLVTLPSVATDIAAY